MPSIPAACSPEQAVVNNWESELQALYDERDNAEPPLSSAQKGELGTRINAALRKRGAARMALAECIALNAPPQPVDPQLLILDIEVVNSVQRRNNTLRLARGKSALVRVFVGSGITNGYDAGFGPGRVPNIRGTLRVVDADNGVELFQSETPINPPTPDNPLQGVMVAQPAPASDRNNAAHSLNFRVPGTSLLSRRVRFEAHVYAQGREAEGGGFVADGEVMLEIPERREAQLIVPVLIAETVSGDGVAPSMETFISALQGAIDRYPIPEFSIVAPRSLSTSRDLSTLAGWDGLLYDLGAWMGTSSQYPGIVAGLVKFNASHPINGKGVRRQFLANRPKFVSQPSPVSFAHEMGHAFGIGHAVCRGDEGDRIDLRLPGNGRTDQPGADVRTGRIVPAGTGELMSYCDLETRWPSEATYNIVYDNMPI